MKKPTENILPPLRKPTSLEIWTYLAGMLGYMNTPIVQLEEMVEAADDAEEDVMEATYGQHA